MIALMPMRPTFFRSAWPAMPLTSVAKSRGAMITLIICRNIWLSSRRLTPKAGKSLPISAPTTMPTMIHVVSERLVQAKTHSARIASQRTLAETGAGICIPPYRDRTYSSAATKNSASDEMRAFRFIEVDLNTEAQRHRENQLTPSVPACLSSLLSSQQFFQRRAGVGLFVAVLDDDRRVH